MELRLGAAYHRAVDIYLAVLGDPWRSLRFAGALLVPYLALSLVVPPANQPLDEASSDHGLLVLVHTLLLLGITARLAVCWHRYLLLADDGPSWLSLAFGARELRYLVFALLIAVFGATALGFNLALISPLITSAFWHSGALSLLVLVLASGVSLIFLAFVFARFGLALPAAAIDRRGGLVTSWQLTRHGWLPLCTLLVLISLPQALAITVVDPVMAWGGGTLLWYLLVPIRELVLFATAGAFAIALSSNYAAVVRATGEPDDHGAAGGA